MAKIYETQADYEKDALKEQAHQLRHRAEGENKTSWMLLAGALLADLWNATKTTPSRVLTVAGWGMFFASIVETVKSWQSHGKARDLELERERLGPEAAVLPPEKAADCGCKDKHARGPTTLLEQASRSGFPLFRQ